MINIHLSIDNPWFNEKIIPFKDIFYRSGRVTKNKSWEFQIYKSSYHLMEFSLRYDLKGCDHAGLNLNVNLFGYNLDFVVVDNRHWDYNNNCWEVYKD